MEWIDPRYAEVIAAMKAARARAGDHLPDGRQRAVRGFVVPRGEAAPRGGNR
jgi:hypothetical protein